MMYVEKERIGNLLGQFGNVEKSRGCCRGVKIIDYDFSCFLDELSVDVLAGKFQSLELQLLARYLST